MTYFISIVDGETKRAKEAVGTSRLFYAGALKAFKRELGNNFLVPHLRLKSKFYTQRPRLTRISPTPS